MSIFKCKMCGGTIEFEPGATVGVCDSCGTKQTLPRLDDDRRTNLYDRANHFRRNNEFDKAMGIYEQILNEDNTDAEAYWSLVLCRYGIEYVEDPLTHRRLPTVNRAQFTSIFDDDNYQSALRYADPAQKALYYEEAQTINEIQKGILQISQKEDPFDVFICYKETDAAGRRTPDSVLANDLYHQLTQEGFKVFFSRITLENKLGTAYEPYIFAALNSAKVMVVLGTRPEYFNAVWVKNEWARYLALIKNGAQKTLIPAYKDMDPYDLPDEFSHLQALDMSRLGFMQDLIRGIKKISGKDQPKVVYTQPASGNAGSAAAASLLRRAFMFLEDGNWQEADQYCEKVLDMEPENARAYLGKLMAELQVKTPDGLGEYPQPFDDRNNYQKALRFGDEKLRSQLTAYIQQIRDRQEYERRNDIYNQAVKAMNDGAGNQRISQFNNANVCYRNAENLFASISGFQDADAMAENCRNYADICGKDAVYKEAQLKMRENASIRDLEAAIKNFQQIPGWRDCDNLISICTRKIADIKAWQEAERLRQLQQEEAARIKAEKKKQRMKTRMRIFAIIIAIAVFMTGLWLMVIQPKIHEYKLKQKYGQEAVSKYGVIFFDKYGEDFIDLYGIDLFDNYGTDFVDSYGEEAIKQYEPDFYRTNLEIIQKYGLFIFKKYGEEFINKYGVDFFDKYGTDFVDLIGKEAIEQYDPDFYQTHDAEFVQITLKYPIGSTITFGNYEQDNNTANGKEPIEWIILDNTGTSVLIISKDALDCKPYHTERTSVTWETSSIRSWLNESFLNEAFSMEEQLMISTITVSADKNPNYDTYPGRKTSDKIFLLSIIEAERYFSSDSERRCKPTDYARAHGAYEMSNGYTWWWLRTPGYRSHTAASISSNGALRSIGNNVELQNTSVRPALWINPAGEIFRSEIYPSGAAGAQLLPFHDLMHAYGEGSAPYGTNFTWLDSVQEFGILAEITCPLPDSVEQSHICIKEYTHVKFSAILKNIRL